MAKETKYGIIDFQKDFPNEDACLDYLFSVLHTKECSCGGTYNRIKERKQYQCSKCRFQIAPMAGTIFEKSTTHLLKWFHAIFIFSNAKSGISAKEMERQLNVTYKTAWRILKLIRECLGQGNFRLRGDVEMDEAYFGGRGYGGEDNKNASSVMANKSKVIGAVERNGVMRAKKVPNVRAITIEEFIDENIDLENTRLLTDSSNRYGSGYHRQTVNHSKKQYVSGDVYVNNIESFWSHVKRSVKGTHKVISKKYLQSYLDAFVWHYNNRYNDRVRFDVLLSAILQ
ncbi:MAG: IS1595 family transposase [Candidatus Magasanikbacteria bacterium]|nr:IS1595 family transposase [Candidatus Magasanikbacteria bacterium]